MIITLKGADFSASNIGTLSTWRITRSLGSGATYEGPTFVDKGASFSATITIAEGYEIGSAGVTVTMGGVGQAYTINGNMIAISIAAVTGNIVIKVPTVNIATGEEEEPEIPDEPENTDITNLFVFTDGIAIEAIGTNGGTTYNTPLFKSSDYVDISEIPNFEMSFVKWRSSTGGRPSLGYALYDADKQYVTGYNFELADASVGNSAGEPYVIKVHITDPAIKYIRTCYPTDANKYGEFVAEIIFDDGELTRGEEITNMFSFTDGAAIEATTLSQPGQTFTTSLFKYSDYVDITNITPFEMSFVTWKSGAGKQATLGYALYDASKTYIGGKRFEFASDSANSSGVPYMITVDPSQTNAKYIRTCYPVDTTKYGEFQAYKLV